MYKPKFYIPVLAKYPDNATATAKIYPVFFF